MRKMHSAVIVLAMITAMCSSSRKQFSEDGWKEQISREDPALLYAPHFKDGKFFNPWLRVRGPDFGQLLEWKFSRKESYSAEEENFRPKIIPDAKRRIESLSPDKDFIFWAGHNTFIIRINGKYWITDPLLTESALVIKRLTPAGISIDDVNALSGPLNIIITHNHHDHLDRPSVKKLHRDSRVIAPLGTGVYLQKQDKRNVTEMDWWQEIVLDNDTKLVCLPAQHFSIRLEQERGTTLWASFLLVTPRATIFIGGDSGYFHGFREIGRKYPGIDYALFSLSAYHPRWFMHSMHMDVGEALRAFDELGARHFIPGHWGTFRLGDEPIGHPSVDLRRQIEKRGLDTKRFIIMDIGEIVIIPDR